MVDKIKVDSVKHGPHGEKTITYSNGQGRTFGSADEVAEFANQIPAFTIIETIIAKTWVESSPDLSDDSSIEGKTFVYNPLDNTAKVEVL